MSIRSRLFLLIVATLIPAILLVSWSAIGERRLAIETAERETLNLVRLARNSERRAIAATRQILASLATVGDIKSVRGTPACNRLLAELLSLHPSFTNLGVADIDGEVVCSAQPITGAVSIADRDYFQQVLRTRAFSVGTYQTGRLTGITAINFGYPVHADDGSIAGVVYAALNLSAFEALVRDVALPAGATVTVTDSSSNVLLHSAMGGGNGTGSSPVRALLERIVLARKEGVVEWTDRDGVVRIYAFAPVLDGGSGDIFVSVGIPRATVTGPANRDLLNNLLFMLAVFVTISVIAWHGVEKVIGRRLKRLSAAVDELMQGDAQARSQLPPSNDEIGEVSRGFDNMAETLDRKGRTLQILSDVNRALLRAKDEQSLLGDMCRIAVRAGNYSLVWIGYARQDDAAGVDVVAAAGLDSDPELLAEAVSETDWAGCESLAVRAIRSRREQIAQDGRGAGMACSPSMLHDLQSQSAAVFPLLVEERAVGAISIHAPAANAFDEAQIRLLRETASDLAFGISVLRAREEHRETQRTVERMALFDSITGLPNYWHFLQRLAQQLDAPTAADLPLGVVLINLDRFHEVNEAFGTDEADRVLRKIGARLQRAVADNEFVARMRGDEFAVLMPALDERDVSLAVRNLLSAIQKPADILDIAVDVSACAGVALAPDHGSQADALIRCAEVALRVAKQSRVPFVIYSDGINRTSPERLALTAELRHAVRSGELLLHFQPKVELASGRVIGAEALVRWNHPARGLVSPAEFIPLAEHTGLIKPLTDVVLESAIRQAREWQTKEAGQVVSVNVSPRNLQDPTFLHYIQRLLDRHQLPPGLLELEITESAIMEDVEHARHLLEALNETGVALSIDDFGTGYSSLSYLQRLPVDHLKIDQSFVGRLLQDTDSETIVASTIRMAHGLGLKVVAEGVENGEVLHRLIELECDVAQGFHIARPMPAALYDNWLLEFDLGKCCSTVT